MHIRVSQCVEIDTNMYNTKDDSNLFSCADRKLDEKKIPMKPWPVEFVTCTCNYNKPTNIRCRWSKVKKSTVKCIDVDT